jgi:hypothetical protein
VEPEEVKGIWAKNRAGGAGGAGKAGGAGGKEKLRITNYKLRITFSLFPFSFSFFPASYTPLLAVLAHLIYIKFCYQLAFCSL